MFRATQGTAAIELIWQTALIAESADISNTPYTSLQQCIGDSSTAKQQQTVSVLLFPLRRS